MGGRVPLRVGKMLWGRALCKLKAVIRFQKDGQKKKKSKSGVANTSTGNLGGLVGGLSIGTNGEGDVTVAATIPTDSNIAPKVSNNNINNIVTNVTVVNDISNNRSNII
uniref:Uncharacterized protein n=1 Tax=Polytomella parva TaxID=51329 RepID=A0A7S0YEG5_9CHLO